MRVTVKYMAQLKQAAGTGSETLDLEARCTLAELVAILAERHEESFRRILLTADRDVQPSVLFFVNDEQVRADDGRRLQDNDLVTVLAPMAGG